VNWTYSGDGSFDDPSLLSPIYTPGPNDRLTGSVVLYFEVFGNAPCGSVSDSLVITIPPLLEASVGTQAPFLIGPNTKIKVKVKTKNHSVIQDLDILLIDPDGNDTLTLTKAKFGWDKYGMPIPPMCGPLAGDINILYDRDIAAPFDFCSAVTPPNGSYGIEDSWNKLHGLNPAKGGWSIVLRDWFSNAVPTDGEIDSAYITFTDTSVFTNRLTTISYTVQTSGLLIPADYSLGYRVPIALRTTCSNSCDARAIVNPIGGIGPYTYQWNDAGSSTTQNVDLCKGTFTVTVTDALGCTATATVDVSSPDAINITGVNYSLNDTLTCYGETTDITINATGGSGSLKYTYDGAPAPNDTVPVGTAFTGFGSGTYNFHIFDVNGCMKDTVINIIAPDTLNASVSQITNVRCFGDNSGSATIKVQGGTPKYVFILKQGITNLDTIYTLTDSAVFNNLAAGTYQVALRDTNNCSITPDLDVTISQPASALTINDAAGWKNSCSGINDGNIAIDATGGTLPYTYIVRSISDSITSVNDTISNLPDNAYTVIVLDANGCLQTFGSAINIQSYPVVIDSIKFSNNDTLLCGGDVTDITIYASGGSGIINYTYNGAPVPNDTLPAGTAFAGLTRGSYQFHIFDASGCYKDTIIDIIAPDTLKATLTNISNVNCFGSNSGSVLAIASGGTKKYVFTLKQSGLDLDTIYTFSDSAAFTGLLAGSYTIAVRDTNGCTINPEMAFNITQPAQSFHIDSIVTGKLTPCAADVNGWAKLYTSGGTAPLTYIVESVTDSISSTLDSISGLAIGTYTAYVVDAAGCAADNAPNFTIASDPAILLTLTATDVTQCYNNNNGSVTVIVNRTNGNADNIEVAIDNITGPYIAVTGPAYSHTFTNLARGWYRIYAKDIGNPGSCVFMDSTYVDAPDTLYLATVVSYNIPTSDYTVTATATGGQGAYEFALLDNNRDTIQGFAANNIFNGLAPGRYYVLVRDGLGCIVERMVRVSAFNIITTHVACSGESTGSILVQSTIPGNYTYTLNGGTAQTDSLFTGLAAGEYFIRVYDNGNLVYLDSTIINEPANPIVFIPLAFDLDSSLNKCSYDRNVTGNMVAIVLGGTPPLEYSGDGINYYTDQELVRFGGGTHVLYVRDALFCVKTSAPFNVYAPEPVNITLSDLVPVRGSLKGSVIASATGPDGPIQFSLDGAPYISENPHKFSGLSMGGYTLVAQNTIGCTDTAYFYIPVAPALDVLVSVDSSRLKCIGDRNATIYLTIRDVNVVYPAKFSINPPGDTTTVNSDTISFPNKGAGKYYIYVEDSTGRVFYDSLTIKGPPVFSISSNISPAKCAEGSLGPEIGAIELTLSNEYNNYSFDWSTGDTTEDIYSLSTGTYYLHITYGPDSCVSTSSYTVSSLYSIYDSVYYSTLGPVCPGTKVFFEAQAGSGYKYEWSPGKSLSDSTSIAPIATLYDTTTYTVTISDTVCYITRSFDIDVFNVPILYSGPDSISVPSGGSTQLVANEGFASYLWDAVQFLDNPISRTPNFAPLEIEGFEFIDRYYYIIGTSFDGCEVTDSVYLSVAGILSIPLAFTPNGDGAHDFWDIKNAEYYPDIIIQVFNRWGQKVFESKGYADNQRFDGTRNGKPLPSGTYYYVIHTSKYSLGITGSVTIVR
jgi:gliding motility-associated-like protein